MRMFELLPRPLGAIFRKLTHLTCNLPGLTLELPIFTSPYPEVNASSPQVSRSKIETSTLSLPVEYPVGGKMLVKNIDD